MLAVTFFRRDRLNESMAAFEKSLELNGKNARARHYLGVITSKMGLTTRAEKEFKSALAIDPGYGDADFNLAVLYATSDPPKWDEARKHYNDAIKKGVKADTNLEKLLNGAGAVSKR
jgi:tetratricopeptide (TPR) repeat protein